ncbi:UDP-N-acetylglucosamine--N-acetylmuramyl-(pentapeptide) pyrophosphoryl-undecaprenol N-acetylglucosamine transferase [bacterium]|jgi:UDP-N-acetylglucosamine--N-acetylmuramyl-(pentapeptide) pyrophosphoryl-undecaprenol N-acetylglucosamine transferase|nr:UDP-N-acetylglucosamine--N-acetylmuramyl-(pentapeptide) pyrophosphoryl-undecaprenol N-acetylglucosamine transferase [bacterium]
MKQKLNHICFVGGQSGGHLIPCFTLAKKITQKNPNYLITLISTNTSLEKQLVQKTKYIKKHLALSLCKVPRRKIVKLPIFLFQLFTSFSLSLWHLIKNRPEKIISTGSYIAIPVCIAAKLLNIPIELYELNVEPGKAISFLAPIANKINICFKESQRKIKKTCTPSLYPVRFTTKDLKIKKNDAIDKLGIQHNLKTILVLGGSQGSKFIDETIHKIFLLSNTLKNNAQVIHQTGSEVDYCKKFYEKNDIQSVVFDHHKSLELCYRAADLIICRAGAGTLFETVFFKKTCITIPLQTGTTSHQKDNAISIAKQYKFVHVLDQQKITKNPKIITNKVHKLLKLNNLQKIYLPPKIIEQSIIQS